MSLIDTLKSWLDQDATKLIYHHIDPNHVDRQLGDYTIEAGRHYFRLWLAEMFLQKQVQWATIWYPAVHALVRCEFGNQVMEIPNIADSTRMGMQQSGQGDVIVRNFLLTPTLPFNGGSVTLDAGLMAIKGQNYLNDFIKVLGNFAGLLSVPQLSSVIQVAQPLVNGIQDLFNAGKDHLHLGLHETFVADTVKPGYIAVIRAAQQAVDISKLWVLNDQLREGRGPNITQNVPFEQFDYILFRTEIFEKRDDWEKLTSIQEPFQEAIKALGDFDERRAQFLLQRALVQAKLAPELTKADRRRVVDELKKQFSYDKEDLGTSGLVGKDVPTLSEIMEHAMPVHLALELGEPTFDEIFNINEG